MLWCYSYNKTKSKRSRSRSPVPHSSRYDTHLKKVSELMRYFRNLMRNIRDNIHLSRCAPGHTLFKWESTPHMKILQTNHSFEDVIVTSLQPQMLRQRKNVHLQLVFLQVVESISVLSTLINLVSCTRYLKVVQLQGNSTMIFRVLFLLI